MPLRRFTVLFVALALATAVGACSDGPGYGKATEANFLTACNPDKDAARDGVCRCAYDEVKRRYTYSQYADLNKRLESDKNDIPSEIVDVVAGCAAPASSSSSSSSR